MKTPHNKYLKFKNCSTMKKFIDENAAKSGKPKDNIQGNPELARTLNNSPGQV